MTELMGATLFGKQMIDDFKGRHVRVFNRT